MPLPSLPLDLALVVEAEVEEAAGPAMRCFEAGTGTSSISLKPSGNGIAAVVADVDGDALALPAFHADAAGAG